MTPKFDFVTVTFSEELPLLALQAKSFAMYVDPEIVGTIFIVVNDEFKVSTKIRRSILWRYGDLSNKVKIIYKKLDQPSHGWKRQQILKLLASRDVHTDTYIILDSKNHFIKPFSLSQIISPSGKLYSLFYRMHPPYRENFKEMCNYFNYTEHVNFDKVLPSTTPYFMKTKIVRQLLEDLEEREGLPAEIIIHNKNLYSEFYLYYLYLLSKNISISDIYESRDKTSATLYSNSISNPELFSFQLEGVEHPQTYCLGIHRKALAHSTPTQINQIHELWKRFNLVETEKEFLEYSGQKPLSSKNNWLARFSFR